MTVIKGLNIDNPDNLTVITTHLNADYDALGSMLAAHKLYPGSLVVFPGFHEKSSKNFFVHSVAYLFNMIEIRHVDISKIKTLVIRKMTPAVRKNRHPEA